MGEDRKHLRKISPIEHADAVRVPILILHAAEDAVVPVEQSRKMARRLRSAHKNVRYVELSGDDHWLSLAQTRTQMLREIESFLAKEISSAPAQRAAN
jgi:dipeptidyl aminopeptidase/acylaminoacyl peptidase